MSKYKKSRESAKLDLTPLIDVVFLLIIFFMVTTTFNNFGSVQIDLPSSTIQQTDKTKSIEIIIDKDGNYHISEDGKITQIQFSEIDSILKTIDINNIKNNYSENEIIYADYISMSFYLLKDNKQIYHSFLPESGKEWHILNLTQDYIIKNDTVNADKWKLFYDK